MGSYFKLYYSLLFYGALCKLFHKKKCIYEMHLIDFPQLFYLQVSSLLHVLLQKLYRRGVYKNASNL